MAGFAIASHTNLLGEYPMTLPAQPTPDPADIAETVARHDAELKDMSSDLDAVKQSQATLQEQVAQNYDELRRAMEEHASQNRAEFTEVRAEIQEVRAEVAEVRAEVAEVRVEVAEVRAEVAEVRAEVAEVRTEVAEVRTEVTEVRTEITEVKQTVNRMDSRLGNVIGSQYERYVAKIIERRLRRELGIPQAETMHLEWGATNSKLTMLVDHAADNGAITEEEREYLLHADIIARGLNAYAVVEIGTVVNSTHVNRAARRAAILAKAAGAECHAAVVGSEIPEPEQQRAARNNVAVIAIPELLD